jgi:hypothetical protein
LSCCWLFLGYARTDIGFLLLALDHFVEPIHDGGFEVVAEYTCFGLEVIVGFAFDFFSGFLFGKEIL